MQLSATTTELFDVVGFNPLRSQWGALVHADMDNACTACELWRTLSKEEISEGIVAA